METNQVNNPLIPILKESGIPVKIQENILPIVNDYVAEYERWLTLASVEVVDHTDTKGIKLAEENRKEVKRKRNEAEKFLDSKRSSVQEKMADYTAEDKAYLRIKQFFENKGKELEAVLKEKAETAERYQKQLLDNLEVERLQILTELEVDGSTYAVRTMSAETFATVVNGIKFKKQEEAAQKEKEVLLNQRLESLTPFLTEGQSLGGITLNSTEEEFKAVETQIMAAYYDVQEAIQLENQKIEIFNNRKKEMTPYFGLNYEGKGTITKDTSEEDYQVVLSNAKAVFQKAEEEKAFEAIVDSRRKRLFQLGFSNNGEAFIFKTIEIKEQTVREQNFDPESYAQEVADIKTKIEKENAERLAAEKETAKTNLFNARLLEWNPLQKFSEKILTRDTTEEEFKVMLQEAKANELKSRPVDIASWVDTFKAPVTLETFNDVDAKKVNDILTKFEGFKKWARSL